MGDSKQVLTPLGEITRQECAEASSSSPESVSSLISAPSHISSSHSNCPRASKSSAASIWASVKMREMSALEVMDEVDSDGDTGGRGTALHISNIYLAFTRLVCSSSKNVGIT